MSQLTQELVAGRLRAMHFFPYFASMIHRLVPVQNKQIPTMAVDRWWRLIYNPEFVARLTVDQVAWCIMHEIMHLFRDHAKRCLAQQFDPRLYNFAGDFAINDDLAMMKGIVAPEGILLPSRFKLPDRLLEEDYYEMLKKVEHEVKREIKKLIDAGMLLPGAGRCGSCANGKPEKWEPGAPGEGGTPAGVSPTIADLVRQKVAEDLLDYASKHPGSVPGSLRRVAEDIAKSKIPWRVKLKSSVSSSVAKVRGMTDYTFRRPSRRQIVMREGILPSLQASLCRLAVIVDTSGSMTAKQLGQALAEIKAILDALQNQIAVTVLSVDAAVAATSKVLGRRKLELFGGGGTDMGVGLDAASRLRPRPDVAVVLTDGYTAWPAVKPSGLKKVIVVILRPPQSLRGRFGGFFGDDEDEDIALGPDWAECIYVDSSEARSVRLLLGE